MKIKDVRDIHATGNENFVRGILKKYSAPMPKETDAERSAIAEINHGRLIVRCPFCKGAELADRDDKRFFCLSCFNQGNGGKWIPVVISEDEQSVEPELLKRPHETHRNWRVPETLEDLRKENEEHGLA